MSKDKKQSLLQRISNHEDQKSILSEIEEIGIGALCEGRNFLYYAAKAGDLSLDHEPTIFFGCVNSSVYVSLKL